MTLESKVTVGQFYGIEMEEFPCKIAETAMHLADHLANLELSAALGQVKARFPIQDTAHILTANACDADWSSVLPPAECTYMLGNPPFVGMAWMSDTQKGDRTRAFAALQVTGARTGRLDYVASWYAKAIGYVQGRAIRAAFVSTNSIAQGDQARALGPLFLASGIRIDFAHRTFEWQSEARGTAHVHVVIVGFSHFTAPARQLRLFDYPTLRSDPVETVARNINIYLVDGLNIIPAKRDEPLRPGMPAASKGSQPTDGKNLTVTEAAYPAVMSDPIAAKYVKPYWGSWELLRGTERWCLWLVGADPADLTNSPIIRPRLERVRAARLGSKTVSVQDDAGTPSLFTQIRQPAGSYIAMPEVSSGARTYIPVALLPATTIASNKLICWPSVDMRIFALLSSKAFTTWQGSVGGRLKSDYSISPDLSYCTFPWPEDTLTRRRKLEDLGERVLDARSAHPGATLADLYNPLAMPANLVDAHRALDTEVDRQVTGKARSGQGPRLSALLQAYQDLTQESEPKLKFGPAPSGPRRRSR